MAKPTISERFEKLLHTQSEADFFLILTGSIAGDIDSVYDEKHGFGLQLTIWQNLTWKEPDRTVTQLLPTHSFTLYENNTLMWTILNRPTITGLAKIQSTLQTYRRTFDQSALTAHATRGTPQ